MPECGNEIFQTTDIVACISMRLPSSAHFTQPPNNNQAVRAQRNGGAQQWFTLLPSKSVTTLVHVEIQVFKIS